MRDDVHVIAAIAGMLVAADRIRCELVTQGRYGGMRMSYWEAVQQARELLETARLHPGA